VRSLRRCGRCTAGGGLRAKGVSAPTLREAGFDVVFANWRGLVAPPGLAAADEKRLIGPVEELDGSPTWRQEIDAHGWIGAYLPGLEFGEFLTQERQRVSQIMLGLNHR
jgi:putative tricarboxylic transport membrane protein